MTLVLVRREFSSGLTINNRRLYWCGPADVRRIVEEINESESWSSWWGARIDDATRLTPEDAAAVLLQLSGAEVDQFGIRVKEVQ